MKRQESHKTIQTTQAQTISKGKFKLDPMQSVMSNNQSPIRIQS